MQVPWAEIAESLQFESRHFESLKYLQAVIPSFETLQI